MVRVDSPLHRLARQLRLRPGALGSRSALASDASRSPVLSAPGDFIAGSRGSRMVFAPRHRAMSTTRGSLPATSPRSRQGVAGLQTRAFRTSRPTAARLDTSTIDFAVMPTTASLFAPPSTEPFVHLRVPLAPDNYAPARLHPPDAPVAPLAAPEILVLAAHPENVAPSALTEVEGMGLDGVELNFAHDVHAAADKDDEREPGMITDLWRGLLDDVFGETKKPTT